MCFLLHVDDVLIACTVCHCHRRRPRSWLLLLMFFLRRVGDHVFYVALPLQEAKELGLLLEVHPPEQLLPAAHDLARRIAAAAPAAVSATLQMLRLQLPQHVLQEAARLEAKEQAGALRRARVQLPRSNMRHTTCYMGNASLSAIERFLCWYPFVWCGTGITRVPPTL